MIIRKSMYGDCWDEYVWWLWVQVYLMIIMTSVYDNCKDKYVW